MTAVEKGLEDHEPRIVSGVKGAKSKSFSKKFRNQAHMEKWMDSDDYGNHEVHHISKVNEETDALDFEQIDEISKKTLGSYVKKASEKATEHSYLNGIDDHTGDYKRGRKEHDKTQKRLKGISKATDRLTKEDTDMEEIEQNVDEVLDEAAADSLKPGSHSVNDPKSKPEAMASVLGALGAMPTPWVLDHAKELLTQYEKWKTNAAKGSAESNKATQNMKPSDAKGGAGPAADGAMKSLGPKPALWDATKEEVETIFGGESLTEEAQGKISALFEAAVTMRVSLIEAELEEAFESELTEAMAVFIEETQENLDKYVEYAVDQWIAENEVAVVDTLRLENTEQFIDKLKDLFLESYIDVPEERLDVVREMSDEIVDLEAQLHEALTAKAELEEAVLEAARDDAIDEVSEGLTLADSEKLKTLVENVEFNGDVDSYSKKLRAVRENYFDKKSPPSTSGSVDQLNEEGSDFSGKQQVIKDPFVAASLKALRTNRG